MVHNEPASWSSWQEDLALINPPVVVLSNPLTHLHHDQVTAHGALVAGGLGKTTTGVQFYITNPTDTALVYKVQGGSLTQSAASVSVSEGPCEDVASTNEWTCADQVMQNLSG
jgi:hypothetical protein